MVKQTLLWKIPFFKNDDSNGGAMADAIKHCHQDNIVIHSQTKKNGRAWGYCSPDTLLDLIQKNHGIYEVISKFPHKVYFDIDGKCDHLATQEQFQDWLNNILTQIEQFFPNPKFAVSGSNTENKKSVHIILNNYIIKNEDDRHKMKILVKHIRENINEQFDHTVYTKNRNMKLINQSKDDGRVQEIITCPDDFGAHCITCFIPEDAEAQFPIFPEEIEQNVLVAKSKHTFDLGELPKLNLQCPNDINIATITPTQVLELLPNTNTCNFTYRHLVCRFCYTNDVSFETFFAWIVQRFDGKYTNEKVQQWTTHWNNIHKFPPASIEKIKPILKFYYPHIAKDVYFRKFAQTFELPGANIENIETISQPCFQRDDKKYLIFNVGMGGGKTAQTISYLKNEPNFLWIAPNKALASNTHKRFEDENLEVCNYDNIKTKDKKTGKMKEENSLIICLNSIHYISNTKYDVLVIDEIETLIDKFLGDFLEQGKNQLKSEIWDTFLFLFRNAKKVLLLDAFITTKTINLLKSIETDGLFEEKYVIYERINEPQTRTIKYMDSEQSMLQDIITKIKQGCKLFIFYPYKNASAKTHSMEQIYSLIKTATGKNGIFYNADVDDRTKKGLKDVNTSWQDKDFVITNNIITCGVNYENLDFDYKYIFIASHNTPRDIIQVSYRARHLSSGIIKICYMGKMNQSNTWINDCEKMNCPIYKKMHDQILIEKKAPIKRAIQLFCVKAHYKQKTDDFKVNATIEKELNHILESQSIGMTYDNIPDIDWSQAEHIEDLCFCQQATMCDKYSLNKYYFKKSFTEDTPASILADIWDEKYSFFFQRMSSILTEKNHLFNCIADFNKYNNLFPTDVKKLKLNDELKSRIFKEFSFKFITPSSSTTKITKEIYNTYFAKNIVTTTYDNDKNQNVIYEISEKVYEYYELAKNNLVLDNVTYMTYNKIEEIKSEQEDGCFEM